MDSSVRITKLHTQWWEELMCGLCFVSFKYPYLFWRKRTGGITCQHALVFTSTSCYSGSSLSNLLVLYYIHKGLSTYFIHRMGII